MPGDEPQFSPGTPVRVARQSAMRANFSIFDDPVHEYRGDIGWVMDVKETPQTARYDVRFDSYGDEQFVFKESELEPAPPRKT